MLRIIVSYSVYTTKLFTIAFDEICMVPSMVVPTVLVMLRAYYVFAFFPMVKIMTHRPIDTMQLFWLQIFR